MEEYILDICLVIPLAWGLVRGLYKGIILSVGSFIGMIAGIYLANAYASDLTALMLKHFVLAENLAHAIAYFIIFVGVTILVFLISKLLDKVIKVVMLSWVNRLLGAVVGVLKYAIVLSVLLNLIAMAEGYVSILPEKVKSESVLYKPIYKFVPTVLPYVKFYVMGDEKA